MIEPILTNFATTPTAPACSTAGPLGFPTWYAYLPLNPDCSPQLTHLSDVWLIAAAVVEILLRLAAIAAIVMIIYGGVQYVLSRGQPDKAQQARSTIINAVIGLVLAVTAAALVTFVAGRFSS